MKLRILSYLIAIVSGVVTVALVANPDCPPIVIAVCATLFGMYLLNSVVTWCGRGQ